MGILRNVHMFPADSDDIAETTTIMVFFAELEDFPSIRRLVKHILPSYAPWKCLLDALRMFGTFYRDLNRVGQSGGDISKVKFPSEKQL
jgi:hypothetical protein